MEFKNKTLEELLKYDKCVEILSISGINLYKEDDEEEGVYYVDIQTKDDYLLKNINENERDQTFLESLALKNPSKFIITHINYLEPGFVDNLFD